MVSVPHSDVMKPVVTGSDCLLVSCSDLVPNFELLELEFDEAFLEESAINSIQRSVKKHASGECRNHYKFVIVNLDDPTLLLGRFIVSIDRILSNYPDVKIEVFATAATGSDRILKKCQELKVHFISKPLTEAKLKAALKAHLH